MLAKVMQTPLLKLAGDLVSVFKPLNVLLCSYNQKLKVPLSLPRVHGGVEFALLEIALEATEARSEWKLKLGGVGITREFKPTYSYVIPGVSRRLHKFIFDVTGILKSINQTGEGLDLVVKYEGGEPFKALGVLLDTISADPDALVKYKHFSGLIGLNQGDQIRLGLDEAFETGSSVRVVAYTVSQARVSISAGHGEKGVYTVPAFTLEEILLGLGKPTKEVTISLEKSERPLPVLISSVTVYHSEVKAPQIDLCSVQKVVESSEVKLVLEICNTGATRPDKLVVSLIRGGELLRTFQEDGRSLEPGSRIVREVRLPLQTLPRGSITVRLIWTKLSKRWFIDRYISV